MRGAFGKGLCKSARVAIGQVLMSVRVTDDNIPHAKEALRRAKFKFPGRQKIFVSRKFGFTDLVKSDFYRLQKEGKIIPDGLNVKVVGSHGFLNRLPMFKNH